MWEQQTDSPAASRPGFRMACQLAANYGWDIVHMDLKTAFLQGERDDETRNIICALPKEAGHPPHMAARMKKPAYGLNDAPRRWFNVVDQSLRSYGCKPTRSDRCTYVLYSKHHLVQGRLREPVKQSDNQFTSIDNALLEKLLDPLMVTIQGVTIHVASYAYM